MARPLRIVAMGGQSCSSYPDGSPNSEMEPAAVSAPDGTILPSTPEVVEGRQCSGGPCSAVSLFGNTRRQGLGLGRPTASANRATETNHVSVGVGDGTFTLPVILVPRTVHFDPSLSPILSDPVGVLTVDVEHTVTRRLASLSLGKVDREVSIPVSEGIGVVVE